MEHRRKIMHRHFRTIRIFNSDKHHGSTKILYVDINNDQSFMFFFVICCSV